jgi:hypothetical protein
MTPKQPNRDELLQMTRRYFFKVCGYGIGSLALNTLMQPKLFASTSKNPLAPKAPHFKPRAKRIIFLFMAGAPSQIDLFDPKPVLQQYHGQPCPEEILKGERFAFIKGTPTLLGSPYKFQKHGQSGIEVSELLPNLAKVVDDLCIIRSMQTDQFNHAPAQIFMNTGHQLPGRPSMGSWLTYGLGTENQDLPGFVVLLSGANRPDGGHACWSSGFLPTVYQGVEFRKQGDPVLYLSNPDGVDAEARRAVIEAANDLNRLKQEQVGDPEIETRIANYELAYRMQTSMPELMDISKEPEYIHRLYGTTPGKPSFANNCLLARRLVERGVRFVQLYHRGWGPSRRVRVRQPHPRPAAHLSGSRPSVCRADYRPQAAGAAGRHAGHLGRRVRTHADERRAWRLDLPGTRPPPARVYRLDGGRRRETRHRLRRDRRTRLLRDREPRACA